MKKYTSQIRSVIELSMPFKMKVKFYARCNLSIPDVEAGELRVQGRSAT